MAQPRRLFWILLLATTALRLWFVASGRWDLSPDEAHYWEWSRRLDWGYYSKGPLVAYLIAAATALGGDTALAVRMPAVIIAGLVMILTYAFVRDLSHDEGAALLAVTGLSLMPLYAAGGLVLTIDPPFVLSWVAGAYAIYRATHGGGEAWWYGAGLAFGGGLLTKLTILMLPTAALCYLLLAPKARGWLGRRQPWLGLLLGIGVAAPTIAWNQRQGWITVRHVLGQAEASTGGLSLRTFAEFVGSQVGAVSPLFFALLAIALIHSGRHGLFRGSDAHLFLFCFSAPVLAFFFAWSVQGKVQANWAAHGYYTAALAAALWVRERWRRPAIRRLAAAGALLAGLTIVVGLFPDALAWAGVRVPPRLDPISRRVEGWDEAGERIGQIYAELARRGPTFLASDRYQIASELAFYVPGHPRTYVFNLGRRMNQYDLWNGWGALRGRDALVVTYGQDGVPAPLWPAFREIQDLGTLTVRRHGVPVQTFTLFHGRGFVAPPAPGRVVY